VPDPRSASCWVALDDAIVDNGCMWYVPGSHLTEELAPHEPAKPGSHVMETKAFSEKDGTPEPLKAGSCALHHGRTAHYTRGNTTGKLRRAYITNYRPESMVVWERERGLDHGFKGIHAHSASFVKANQKE
jgi:phytanoyl-CoA hydroxylase